MNDTNIEFTLKPSLQSPLMLLIWGGLLLIAGKTFYENGSLQGGLSTILFVLVILLFYSFLPILGHIEIKEGKIVYPLRHTVGFWASEWLSAYNTMNPMKIEDVVSIDRLIAPITIYKPGNRFYARKSWFNIRIIDKGGNILFIQYLLYTKSDLKKFFSFIRVRNPRIYFSEFTQKYII